MRRKSLISDICFLTSDSLKMIVGIDEAGRGPLAGSVVSCALHLKKATSFPVRDSKQLSFFMREKIFMWLSRNAVFSVDIATSQEIDRYNILEATMLSFDRAIKGLIRKAPVLERAKFIIDGNIFKTALPLNYVCIEKADTKIPAVSCASIVAKVMRDYLMSVADIIYPEWNFSRHKGYPTKEHFQLIKKHPLSPLHRYSFSPCKCQRGHSL